MIREGSVSSDFRRSVDLVSGVSFGVASVCSANFGSDIGSSYYRPSTSDYLIAQLGSEMMVKGLVVCGGP